MKSSNRMRLWVLAFGCAVAVFMGWSLWLNRSVGALQSQLGECVSLVSRIQSLEPSLRQLEGVLSEAASGGKSTVDEDSWTRAARGYAQRVALLPGDEEIGNLLERTDRCARRILALGQQELRNPGTAEVRLSRITEARAQLGLGVAAIQESSQVLVERATAISASLGHERRQLDNVAVVACLLAALACGVMEISRRDHRKLQATERRLRTAHHAVETHAAELASTNAKLQSEVEQRTESEKQLALRSAELERSNAELERFAYVASHDLQEPLRAVAAHVQILAEDYKGKLDADADESIRHAIEGATHMRLLIHDLLAYSRISRKSDPLEPTSAADAFATALRQLKVAIEETAAEVTCDPLPEVTADPTQLIQLFQNLVGNALKFHGEKPPRVHVCVERTDEGWLFSVRDNGIGFDPQHSERIFAPFERLHGRHEYPGTGVGLAICKKIAERHGGRIWVDSKPGEGSTFRFTMPVPVDAPKIEPKAILPSGGVPSETDAVDPQLSGAPRRPTP
jgi:signal transduction histidine kinase